jgi:hypothetical protein
MAIKVMAAWRSLGTLFGRSDLSGHFGSEVVYALFYALTHYIQGKTVHCRGAGL